MTTTTARAQLARGLLTLALVVLAGPPAAWAAGVVGTGTAASCTDTALNTALTGGGLVTFNCGPAAVTIDISTGSGTKTIAADTTIDGGRLITISGGNTVEVFIVNTGVTLTVQNLTIANGSNPSGDGGGIDNQGGTVNVTNSTVSSNSASSSATSSGGGIFNDAGGTANVTNSTFSFNRACSSGCSGNGNGYGGGGIFNNIGTVTVTNSTFFVNSAGNGGGGDGSGGGGIFNNLGMVTVISSTFSGNIAGSDGGGIYNPASGAARGTVTVSNSTFSANSAIVGYGGGIFNDLGTVTVINSTFSGNSARTGAGGIFTRTFAGDGIMTITNTIVANSLSGAPLVGGLPHGNCFSLNDPITDGGHNLDDGTTCGFTGTGCTATNGTSFCNTNPELAHGGVKNNGGPTQTIALLSGSPAIDHGDPAVCAAPPVNNVDQRGVPRVTPTDPICDIGAFEFRPPLPGAAAPVVSPEGLLLLAVLLSAGGWRALHLRGQQ